MDNIYLNIFTAAVIAAMIFIVFFDRPGKSRKNN
jgi:hypothetical protein